MEGEETPAGRWRGAEAGAGIIKAGIIKKGPLALRIKLLLALSGP